MRINLGSFASIRKRFVDTFNRADNSSDIGTASDGSLWSVIRGTWGILSNKASSSTSASAYPIATIDMPKTNVTIDLLDTANGTGAALWVTDSGNWWGLAVDQETVTTYSTCNASNCNAYVTVSGNNCNSYTTNCNAYNLFCTSGSLYYSYNCSGGFNTSTCSGFNTSTCSAYNAGKTCKSYNASNCKTYNVSNCKGYSTPTPACGGGFLVQTCNSYSANCSSFSPFSYSYCSAYFDYTYACNPVTTYPVYIRLYQSVANTVSQIASQIISSFAQSLKITTSGSQITTKAYSDAAQVTQIGSDWVYTPTGVSLTPKFGIIVTPTNYSQGSTIGDITIS